jgi:excisionase family DNA binding protein
MDAGTLFAELDRLIGGAAPEDLPALVGRLVEAEERARLRVRGATAEGKTPQEQPAAYRLLTLPEVAVILGVPEEHAREMGRRGQLPTLKVGERYVRVRLSALQKWVARQERA